VVVTEGKSAGARVLRKFFRSTTRFVSMGGDTKQRKRKKKKKKPGKEGPCWESHHWVSSELDVPQGWVREILLKQLKRLIAKSIDNGLTNKTKKKDGLRGERTH